ncbi:S-adenosyl-L-methionine-dependent methyltransferase [Atractiella rhizophila]|nr:S-adenosyl-L-methionine-dependent methyltransferase [Atractiella rhizophila]
MSSGSKTIPDIYSKPEVAQQFRKFEGLTASAGVRLLEQSGILSLPLPSPENLKILDNACGTGVITAAIKNEEVFKDVEVTAADISEPMITIVKQRIEEEGWSKVQTAILDVMDLELPSDHFSHTITNFCISTVPHPMKALQETIRVTKPGGIIGFTTWNHIGWFPPVKEAVSRLPGSLPLADPNINWIKTGDWHSTEWVANLLRSPPFSLEDVDVQFFPCMMKVDSAHAYVYENTMILNFITMQWSEEQKADSELKDQVKKSIEQVLEERYGKDTPFEFEFMSLICTGRKPL